MRHVAIFLLTFSALYAEKRYGVVATDSGSALKDSIVIFLLSVIMFLFPFSLALGVVTMRYKKLAKKHFENERKKVDDKIAEFLTKDIITVEIDKDSLELLNKIEKTKKELRRLS